jgi:autophagy-related protein 17
MSTSSSSSLPHNPTPPKSALENLITHLVASKRSLTTTTPLIYRANSIVTLSRSVLEATVIATARSSFLRRGLNSLLSLLQSVQVEVESGVEKAQREFGEVLRGLDESEARLRGTLELLRETRVEASLRPEDERDGEGKSLLDFVDERGVEVLEGQLKRCIDGVTTAVGEVEEGIRGFDDDLKSIRDAMAGRDVEDGENADRDDHSPIPALLQSMEGHAKEMASLLESLVRHFDLCVTAIKHTEGGGAAAQNITGDLPAGVDVSKGELTGPAEPITDEERQEMMEVLERDATEVEDVILEINDRIGEMENQLEHVVAYKEKVDSLYAGITTAFQLLEQVGTRLPAYILQSRNFHSRWIIERQQIHSGMVELDSLRDFYDGFLSAYDGLIIEVARRRTVQNNMEKVVKDAMTKLERLYGDDISEREAFKQDQGDFLPSDIWPGLVDSPVRFAVKRMDGEGGGVPEVPRTVIEQAFRRLNGKL